MKTKKLTQTAKRAMKSLSLVTLLFLLSFASCSDSDDTTPCESNKVAVIFKEASPFFKIMQQGVEETALRRNLIVEPHFVKNDLDYEGQLEILRSLDLKEYKGVIIAPTVSDKLTAELARIAQVLPLVIIDNPVDASINYQAFIGTDNFNAGKAFGAESKKLFDKGNEPMKGFIIKLKNNPIIDQRIEGFMTEAATMGEFTIVEVTKNVEEGVAKIAEEMKKVPAGTNIGIFAANGSSCDLAIEATKTMGARVSIINFDMTQKVAEQMYNGVIMQTQAQNTYGIGFEAVKKIFTSKATNNISANRDIYMPTMLIRYTNMFSVEASKYMKGIDVSKLKPTSFNRSLLAGSFISTSIIGDDYPKLDKMHITFNDDITKMVMGRNRLKAPSDEHSWRNSEFSCILKGDSLIAESDGIKLLGVFENVANNGMTLVYKLKFSSGTTITNETTLVLRRTTVDYSQAIIGTWTEIMDNSEFSITLTEDGIFKYAYKGKVGIGTYDLCGDQLVAQTFNTTTGKVFFYRTAVVTIEGSNMILNGAVYLGIPGASLDLVPSVGVFTRNN